MTDDLHNRVGFAVGTGRCGTMFLAEVVSHEPHVASTHQRNDLSEAFHRYSKWYGLHVDDEGFLAEEERAIRADLAEREYSFESSGYLSLSIRELHERFAAKFVLLIRRPEKVVNSYLRKGWYAEPAIRADANRPLGYQPTQHFHHFLGRIVPSGEAFAGWNQMSRVGKLAWYWKSLNEAVLKQFQELPRDAWRAVRLEDLDHARYSELARFLGFEPTIDRTIFEGLVARKPNSKPDVPSVTLWSDREIQEFETQVAPLAKRFEYEWQVEQLRREPSQPILSDPSASMTKPKIHGRVHRWLSRMRGAA